MKKIIISLIVVLTSMTALAQTQLNTDKSVHLTFKGVPINGTLSEYVAKMKQQGFTHMGTDDGVAMLRGDFAAYKGCIIGVATLKQTDLVSKITVIFPECETWSFLSSNYFSLKEMLTEKYGEPAECVEKFDTSFEPEDDNSKMHEVKFDNCKYYTIYETEKGSIQLTIARNSMMSCFVQLSYFDKINGDKIKDAAMNDL